MGIDWANRDIYNWGADWEARPLIDRILDVPEYLQQFSLYMKQLQNSIVAPNILFPKIDIIKDIITQYIAIDNFYPLDYGWDINDFSESFDYELSANHVTYGLKPYVSTRSNSISEQLVLPDDLIVINEIMASNSYTISDENGEFEDWIEIYNPGSQAVFLGDKFLSDNSKNPQKWQMPQIYIQPHSFLIFWADKDSVQGEMHTNFKLDKDGEQIGIYYQSGTKYLPLDFVVFENQLEDVSFGKFPNGTGPFYIMQNPTPEDTNIYVGTSINYELKNLSNIKVFPNPVSSELNVNIEFSEPFFIDLKIFNSLGEIVWRKSDSSKSLQKFLSLNTETFAGNKLCSGIYFIKIKGYISENSLVFYENIKFVLL
jgi:hypothetical protein